MRLDDLEQELKEHFDSLESHYSKKLTAPSPTISALLRTNMGTSADSVGGYVSRLVEEFI